VWIKRVERWRDSGLSAKEFAAQAGVDWDRLRHWKWRLAKEGVEAKTAPAESSVVSAPLAFVEVTPTPLPNHQGDEGIEILAPSGFRIRVTERFDADTLRRVLAAMR
jgi:transposase